MRSVKVYVASPLGFTGAGRHWYREVLCPALSAAGVEILDPWEAGEARFAAVPDGPPGLRRAALEAANAEVGAANAAMITEADAVLAVLDGPDVDSGTAAEVGYASALGRRVVGLRTDIRPGGDNEAAVVNLQVEHFVRASGGVIVTDLEAAVSALVGGA